MRVISKLLQPARSVFGRAGYRFVAVCLVVAGVALAGDGVLINAKAKAAQVLLERAWDRSRAGEAEAKPWPWADIWPVARIEAPRLGESAIVLSGVSGEAMAFGPGLMEGGPVPGAPGTAILAAHRETHFRFLQNIEIGDVIFVETREGARLKFRIEATRIVKANQSGLYTDGLERKIALVTCWPFDGKQRGEERFVAVAALDVGN